MTEITTAAIRALHIDAAAAGDDDMTAICERAIGGDGDARAECARVIDAAAAQMSGSELWARYVGSDSPRDYSADDLAEYLDDCPMGWVPPVARRVLEAYRAAAQD